MADQLINFLMKNGVCTVSIIWVIVIVLILTNIDKILLFQSKIWGLFSSSFSFAKKKQISSKVRGTILKSVKSQQIKNNDIIPDDLKIIWINEEKPNSFVKNNQVIIRIKQSSNPHENLITAVSEYINNGLLYNVRRYLNKDVMDASKILMTRKIVQLSDSNSLVYLDENYIIPEFNKNDELKEIYDDLIRIDNNGMFIGILLNEFKKAGLGIYGNIEDPELHAESKEFMRFLCNIASGVSTDPNDLCFNREYIKIAIFLTASNRTLSRRGIKPFIKAISNQLDDGIETIYVFGLGRKREIAEKISDELDCDYRISNIVKHSYKHINYDSGKRIPGVFYECEIYHDENI